ncbi:MAG: heavy metal translocating P-type ATPase, partial [Actinomycetota bacterium]|nr:heavy metal translocating P-type ATPase [Actinomycetota bacterium]
MARVHEGHDQAATATAVIEVSGLQWASEKNVLEAVLGRRPGVVAVDASPVAKTAMVTYDPARTSVVNLRDWVRDCGYHCAGQSVPSHICDPLVEPCHRDGAGPESHAGHDAAAAPAPKEPAGHTAHAGNDEAPQRSPHEAMGHGGSHTGMSMASMVADMRRRFILAAVLAVPILLWSAIGRDVLGFNVAAPFGLRDDVFQLLLSMPVVGWSAWIFFDGAFRALRARTLDMMVLVAVAVGSGWSYSVIVTFTGGGDVFYEAVAVLTA